MCCPIASTGHLTANTEVLAEETARFRVAFKNKFPGNFRGIGIEDEGGIKAAQCILNGWRKDGIKEETSKGEQGIVGDPQLHGLAFYICECQSLHVLCRSLK